ncbi:msl7333 [Mesorhizobium japonicum MAFF 303099]|uniref:Msl7333 protein n=1 Tax=Mesorhizobium japonicum (strain LMG 29417 / CECT 9101 / MAFF 303099) TaxID=266835 RepID=Q986J2_RHILO|nr:msl7333 [Mesorhizobium japonicum MAFF 303099]
MTPTAYSIITRIEHHLARAGLARATILAPTALRSEPPFQHNQEKPQEGNDR